jgi:hypothetical protein
MTKESLVPYSGLITLAMTATIARTMDERVVINVVEVAGRDVLVVGPGNSGVDLLGYLAASDAGRLWLSARSGMTAPEHPGLWFFGLDSSIYGNMHVHRRQARRLARAIAKPSAD